VALVVIAVAVLARWQRDAARMVTQTKQSI